MISACSRSSAVSRVMSLVILMFVRVIVESGECRRSFVSSLTYSTALGAASVRGSRDSLTRCRRSSGVRDRQPHKPQNLHQTSRLLAMLTDKFVEQSQDNGQSNIISLDATVPA